MVMQERKIIGGYECELTWVRKTDLKFVRKQKAIRDEIKNLPEMWNKLIRKL